MTATKAEKLWQDLLDKGDVTSPEEYPDHALIDFDEFRRYIEHVALPDEMTPAIKDALSFMNFQTGPIAHALRAGGAPIAKKCEDEQAHVLFWFLKLAIEHGDGWREHVGARLKEIAVSAKAGDRALPQP